MCGRREGGIIHVWGRRLREEVPLTTLDFRQSIPFPFFYYTSSNKREGSGNPPCKPQQPVAVESAVQESSRSPGQHLLCFSLPPHQRNLQLVLMHGYEVIQEREDTAVCDGTLCLLVFGETWASVDSFPTLAS